MQEGATPGSLENVEAAGGALDDEELAAELYAVAALVRNEAREVVAAVNLVARNSMITLEPVDGLGPHLVSTADRISARLGYRHRDETFDRGLERA